MNHILNYFFSVSILALISASAFAVSEELKCSIAADSTKQLVTFEIESAGNTKLPAGLSLGKEGFGIQEGILLAKVLGNSSIYKEHGGVIVRPLSQSDDQLRLMALMEAPSFHSIWSNPKPRGDLGLWKPAVMMGELIYTSSFSPHLNFVTERYIIQNSSNKEAVGVIGLSHNLTENTYSISYGVFEPYLRQSYAKNAVQALLAGLKDRGMNRPVEAVVSATNFASIRTLESTGFQFKGNKSTTDGIRLIFQRAP